MACKRLLWNLGACDSPGGISWNFCLRQRHWRQFRDGILENSDFQSPFTCFRVSKNKKKETLNNAGRNTMSKRRAFELGKKTPSLQHQWSRYFHQQGQDLTQGPSFQLWVRWSCDIAITFYHFPLAHFCPLDSVYSWIFMYILYGQYLALKPLRSSKLRRPTSQHRPWGPRPDPSNWKRCPASHLTNEKPQVWRSPGVRSQNPERSM